MGKDYKRKLKSIDNNDPRLKGYRPWEDESLTKEEAAKATKEMFPNVSVREIVRATGWKKYIHWVLTDEDREKKTKYVKDAFSNKKKNLKKIKLEMGGCQICGYIKCFTALEFHHTDPSAKESQVSKLHKIEDIKREVSKCVLLCSNCHREVHEGITQVLIP